MNTSEKVADDSVYTSLSVAVDADADANLRAAAAAADAADAARAKEFGTNAAAHDAAAATITDDGNDDMDIDDSIQIALAIDNIIKFSEFACDLMSSSYDVFSKYDNMTDLCKREKKTYNTFTSKREFVDSIKNDDVSKEYETKHLFSISVQLCHDANDYARSSIDSIESITNMIKQCEEIKERVALATKSAYLLLSKCIEHSRVASACSTSSNDSERRTLERIRKIELKNAIAAAAK